MAEASPALRRGRIWPRRATKSPKPDSPLARSVPLGACAWRVFSLRSVVGWFALPAALAGEAHSGLLEAGAAELLRQVGNGQLLRFGWKLVGTTKAGKVRRACRGSRKGRTRAVPELGHHLFAKCFIGLLDTRSSHSARMLIRHHYMPQHPPRHAAAVLVTSTQTH